MHTIPPRSANEIEGLERQAELRESRAAPQPLLEVITLQARVLCGAPISLADLLADRPPGSLNGTQALAFVGLAEIARHAVDARDALQQAESHYRAIVNDQVEMISLAQADGTLLYVNPAYARHFGKPADRLVGASLYDHVEPRDRESVRELLTRVMHSGQSAYSENRMRAADGSERWVAWTNSVHLEAPHRRLLHSVGRDITPRKQAELTLRASQAFLERTGRVAGVGGWEVDLASGTVTWSDETRRIHEVGPDYEPTLAGALCFYAPEAQPVIQAAVQRGIDEGTPWDLELPFVTATGRSIWVRAMGQVEHESGRAVKLMGAFQDITERYQLEQRVADDERFLRQLADSLPVRIAYLDRERRYRFVNQEALRQFSREYFEVIGRTRAELMPGADDSVFSERARAVLDGQVQRFEFDDPVGTGPRRFENRLIPDRDESGEVRGFFVTGIDITERTAAERSLRELTTIFDNTTDFVIQTDWRGRVVYMNPSAHRAFGVAADEALARHGFADFVTPATLQLFTDIIVPAVKQNTVWVGETRVLLAGGTEAPMSHMVIAHRDPQGRVERYSSVMRDISAEVLVQQEVARQSDVLRSVAEAIPATVVVVGADTRYRFVNSAFERYCGLPRERILGRLAKEVMGEEEIARRAPWMKRALAGETVHFTLDYPAPEGTTYLALSCIPLHLPSGQVDAFVGVGQDITPQKREEARLLQLSQRDPLTGLLNRAGFENSLELQLQQADHGGLAVLYIDLDNFKPVNDLHGHPTGDQVLTLFARRLAGLTRPTDLVARLGGDEFAIALAGLREMAHAQSVAEKVVVAGSTPFHVGDTLLQVGASVGLAFHADGLPSWRDLLAQADAQLLAAKAEGKGRLRAIDA